MLLLLPEGAECGRFVMKVGERDDDAATADGDIGVESGKRNVEREIRSITTRRSFSRRWRVIPVDGIYVCVGINYIFEYKCEYKNRPQTALHRKISPCTDSDLRRRLTPMVAAKFSTVMRFSSLFSITCCKCLKT